MKEKKELSDILEQVQDGVKDLIPVMNVSVPTEVVETRKELIKDEQLIGIYNEIMDDLRVDQTEVDDILANLKEMVFNAGDSSSSSKEALVNVLKIKTDLADKKRGIADLMTRIKLKSPDTFKPYLNAKQDNKTTINIGGDKRQLIEAISRMAKGSNNNEE
jgi:ABC-type transporter Mla subunit MlaD